MNTFDYDANRSHKLYVIFFNSWSSFVGDSHKDREEFKKKSSGWNEFLVKEFGCKRSNRDYLDIESIDNDYTPVQNPSSGGIIWVPVDLVFKIMILGHLPGSYASTK